DDPRPDVARNLRRRSECCALPKPIRLVPELVAEEIPSPPRLLAAVQRFADQHLIPAGLFLIRVRLRPGLAVGDEPEFAVLDSDRPAAWLWLPSARATWRGNHHRLARRAFVEPRRFAALALGLRGVDCTLVDSERPLDMILGQTVAIHGAAVVENDSVGL